MFGQLNAFTPYYRRGPERAERIKQINIKMGKLYDQIDKTTDKLIKVSEEESGPLHEKIRTLQNRVNSLVFEKEELESWYY